MGDKGYYVQPTVFADCTPEMAITREEIEHLLDAAVLAPNHHLTQPWRFYVLGPDARRRYGLALGERKARKLPDPDAANAVREKTAAEYRAFPALIAVSMVLNESPETREEDYAAVMQAISNIMLAAVERGLGIQGMKSLANAQLLQSFSVKQCLDYVLSLPIHCLAVGCTTLGQIEDDARVAQQFKPLQKPEMAEIRERARTLAGPHLENWKRNTQTARLRQPVEYAGG